MPRRPSARRPSCWSSTSSSSPNRAREESDRIIHAGRDALAAERGSIVRELRSELGGLAVELAGRIVGEALEDEARRRGTVERFLEELGSAPAGGKR